MKNEYDIGKKRLQEAILRLYEEENADLQNEDEEEFSPAYEKRMKHLLAENRKRKTRRMPLRRTVAAIVAAVLIGMTTLVLAVGEPMTAFMAQIYEKFTTISIGDERPKDAPDKIQKLYTFTEVPEGYAGGEAIVGTTAAYTTWRTIYNEEIVLSQTVLDTHFLVDTVDADTEIVYIGGYRVFCSVGLYVSKYIWNTEEYFFYMVCDADLPPDEVEAMIASLSERPMPSFVNA